MPIHDTLRESLDSLESRSLLRFRRSAASPCGPRIVIDGCPMLAFASNDYLGLANHPALIAAAADAAQRWGVGSGASHLVSGHSEAHEALESRLATFTGFPAALSFSTGYLANLAVMPALLGRHDAIFADRLNHASLVDGALLSRARLHRYPHGDMNALEDQLRSSTAPRKMIVSDAVFSMDGDIAPLAQLLGLAERYDTWLLLDDAHGFGVLGPQGRGTLAEAGLDPARCGGRVICMGTLGKAAGAAGAFVAGSADLVRWLINSARPYIFTTAAPPMLAEVLVAAIDLIEQADDARAHLRALIAAFRDAARTLPWQLQDSRTAVQPLVVGDNAAVLALSEALRQRGVWVPAIRPPTVPAGTARLRVSLSAAHTMDDIRILVDALREAAERGA